MLKSRLQSRAVEGLVRFGPGLLELRRLLPGRGGTRLFCDPLDAHSWLLGAELWRHRAYLPRDFQLVWVRAPEIALDPEPQLRVRHASRDVGLLADVFELPVGPSVGDLASAAALSAAESSALATSGLERLEAVAADARKVFCAAEPPLEVDYSTAGPRFRAEMDRGAAELRKLGHYQGAMLYDGGAWFWGVDRLPLWLAHATGVGLPECESRVFRPRTITTPAPGARADELCVYFSFRSPYSYLALRRAVELAERHQLRLRLRPVLPMVMRGLSVPRAKKFYLLFDAAREAARLGIPFGRISDPVGAGAERCLAAFSVATEGERASFATRAMQAIWSEGVDVATDAGLRAVCDAVGLAWTRVQEAIHAGGWRELAKQNRDRLTAAGLWGVPSFELGAHVVWGQDRLRVLDRLLQVSAD